jgi:YesN/AraC family two-component response regulator
MIKKILQLKKITEQRTILIVEDDKDLQNELKEIYEDFFLRVLTADNGREGLEKYIYENGSIDLVLSDINMPEMNGLEMCKEIKQIDQEQNIIILSAHSDLKYVLEIIELNIDKFILKPFDLDKLMIKTKDVLEKSNLISELEKKNYQMISLIKSLEFFINENSDIETLKGLIEHNKKELKIVEHEDDFKIEIY